MENRKPIDLGFRFFQKSKILCFQIISNQL